MRLVLVLVLALSLKTGFLSQSISLEIAIANRNYFRQSLENCSNRWRNNNGSSQHSRAKHAGMPVTALLFIPVSLPVPKVLSLHLQASEWRVGEDKLLYDALIHFFLSFCLSLDYMIAAWLRIHHRWCIASVFLIPFLPIVRFVGNKYLIQFRR